MKKIIANIALVATLLASFVGFGLAPMIASADSNSVDFESYSLGSVNGQDGWSSTGPFDQAVVNNTYGYASFGTKTLRISDSATSGSFGDQTFSKPLVNEAGETDALNNGMSGGTRQPHFEAQFDLASTLATLQAGMHVSASPDRGDGARMSYLRFEDQANGIHVFFDDVQGTVSEGSEGCTLADHPSGGACANFTEADIATVSRTPHTIKFSMDFVNGPSNDVVKIYIDGSLVKTGTSWEDYYRFDSESNPGLAQNNSRTVDSVLFRESGTATPADAGKGFLIDNFSEMSGPVPATSSTVHIFKYIDGVQATPASANNVSFPMFTSTYNAPFTLSPSGWTGGDIAYEASTSPMPIGSSYSANENLSTSLVGSTCDGTHNYALVGYQTGDTLSAAQAAAPSLTTPSFTNLQGDKYIIVNNHVCVANPPIKVHVLKYLDGNLATSASTGGAQFPMVSTWNAANIGAGTGNYPLGNNYGGATDQYGADTSAMSTPADYTTSELTNTSLVGTNCTQGKPYALVGYKTGATLSAAQAAATTATAPQLTGLTADAYIIVVNHKCSTPVLVGPPTDMNQCKDNGWKTFNNPTFKNQGDCVSFVVSKKNK
ncbi:MAG TPA: hypothetical protein VHQ20_00375 [Patescibacteria group bacterium]|jgi:hypothetical protein|nr:hypothetical protein [Patescibacteria group bacterium]